MGVETWLDEKIIAALVALVTAILVGWRLAKRLRVSVTSNGPNGEKKPTDSQRIRNDLLVSMDASLKTLVTGQQEAFKKLDRIQEAAESVRREIAEVKGNLFGRSG